MKYQVIAIAAIVFSFFQLVSADPGWTVQSPNSRILVTVYEEYGEILYRVDQDSLPFIAKSKIGLQFESLPQQEVFSPLWSIEVDRIQQQSVDASWSPVFGKRKVIENRYNELSIPLVSHTSEKLSVMIVFRVYDDGVAFRQIVETRNSHRSSLNEVRIHKSLSSITFMESLDWWSFRGERAPIQGQDVMQYPIYGELSSGGVVVVCEGHLRDMAPMQLVRNGKAIQIRSVPNIAVSKHPYEMPWRVIMIGDSAGQLIDSDLIVNLNPKADRHKYDWLKPGVVLWDWRAFGYKEKDGFVYGQDKESWLRFIDFAAETGIPYVMLDANWYGPEHSEDSDPINGGLAGDVRELIRYGEEKGVGLILYLNHVGAMRDGIENIMATYREWGAKGIKYGFMRVKGAEQTKLTHRIARMAEEHELMINFHDHPLPPTGEEAYMPGMANREFCHAQFDAKRSFSPSDFLGMVHVNMMAGPLDMNNGMFDLDDSANMRPRVFSQIDSTLTSEAARTLITYGGGWTVLPDAPGAYREHMDLFRFISAQKLPWTESKTLSSKMGQYISMMRQTGDVYLVGTVTNEEGRTLEIDLSFLPEGKRFKATLYEDAVDAHYKTNREAYKVRAKTVAKGDTITATLVEGGGHCIYIEPVGEKYD
jgi:alpha-glucosidase